MKNAKKVEKQLSKYFTVGVIGGMVSISLMFLITEMINLNYMISAVYSFMSVSLISFCFDKIWTFKEKLQYHFLKEYLNFFSFSVVALIINLVLLYSFTEYLRVYYLISQFLAIGGSGMFNFILDKNWTFDNK